MSNADKFEWSNDPTREPYMIVLRMKQFPCKAVAVIRKWLEGYYIEYIKDPRGDTRADRIGSVPALETEADAITVVETLINLGMVKERVDS